MHQKQVIMIELEHGFANCTVNMQTGEISCMPEIGLCENFAGNSTLWAELCEEEHVRLGFYRKEKLIFITSESLEMLTSLQPVELAA